MSTVHDLRASKGTPPAGSAVNPAVWSVFTRLLHQLDACTRAPDQVREALEAVRESTGADAVCWHDESTGETVWTSSPHPLSPEGCRAVVERLVGRDRGDRASLLWHNPHSLGRPHGLPHSAAAVRLHRSRPGWILALSADRRRPLDGTDVRLIGLAGAMLLKHQHHARVYGEVKESLLGLVRCLAAVIDAKDSCTAGHSERVSRIAVRVGRQMGLPAPVLSDLHLAGLLHDVGKVGIRDEVLLKPGRLTAEEQAHIRDHVVISDQIVATIKAFARLRPGVRHHHERYDGTGYPDRLAGEAIPLLGRVLAVADSCDAMMSARHYRGPMAPPQIDTILVQGAGTQWDPLVVQAFMACREDIYPRIYQKGIGDSAALAIERIVEALKAGSSWSFEMPEEPPAATAGAE